MTERNYHVINQGLKVEPNLTYEQWEGVGRALGRGLDNWHWVIGDWLVYGENAFGERVWPTKLQPGQSKYEKAAMITGLFVETLELCYRVAKVYPQGDRIEGASWSRHKDVMRFTDRVDLLRTSAAEQWSMRRWNLRIGKNSPGPGPKRDVRCPHCGEIIPADELDKCRT